MCGISGSGKTFFARQLEKEGYVRLSLDNLIWTKVGSKLYSLSKEEQKSLFEECRKDVYLQLVELLKAENKVVVDATHCKRSVRDEIRSICAQVKVIPLFIYCHAEEEELWQRLSNRKGDSPDDLMVTRKQFTEYYTRFERPQENETDFIFLYCHGSQMP